jgi:hypothetical protein
VCGSKITGSTVEALAGLTLQIKDWRRDEEREKALEWLSPLSFEDRQKEILSKHCVGTGNWLLESEGFKAWCDGATDAPRGLWCHGKSEWFCGVRVVC